MSLISSCGRVKFSILKAYTDTHRICKRRHCSRICNTQPLQVSLKEAVDKGIAGDLPLSGSRIQLHGLSLLSVPFRERIFCSRPSRWRYVEV